MSKQWYTVGRTHLLRWTDSREPEKPPAELEVLTPGGWVKAGVGVRHYLWRNNEVFDSSEAERRASRACGSQEVDAERITGALARFSGSSIRWFWSPPLAFGAPRRGISTERGRTSFGSELGTLVTEELAAEALAGYERARDRQLSVEARATQFIQAAGLTTTLVLANAALLRGDGRVHGTLGLILMMALLLGSVALVLSSVYGVLGTMHTFSRVAPNVTRRILFRSHSVGALSARRDSVASLLLAQRRTSLVADWKLARLKRAAAAFLIAVAFLAVASIVLVGDALASTAPA